MIAAPAHLATNLDRFSGFADTYDKYRPQPPSALLDLLAQLAQVKRPHLVVDLGSGTGLSTYVWAERADEIVGVEPNADMRRQAEARTAAVTHAHNVRYIDGISSQTGLPNACADIVTCSQALHWMEPEPTFAEVARMLRDGGVFAAYDSDWPPTMNWQAEAAYVAFIEQAEQAGERHGAYRGLMKFNKEEHAARMRASNRFRYVNEIVMHHIEPGNAERLIGLALSQGGVAKVLLGGVSEEEIGLAAFRDAVQRAIGDELTPWYFSYRVRYAIK